jgi:surface protein
MKGPDSEDRYYTEIIRKVTERRAEGEHHEMSIMRQRGAAIAAIIVAAAVAVSVMAVVIVRHNSQQDPVGEAESTQQTLEQPAVTEETRSASEEDTTPVETNVSYLITGPEINDAFFKCTAEKNPDAQGDPIFRVTSLDRSDTAPDNSDDAIDISESGLPTYVWYEDHHIYWYSEAPVVFLNADSSRMFFRLYSCENIDVTGMDTRHVTNMSDMFGATAVHTLDLSGFDTSNVTDMTYLFISDPLESLDLSGFDMSGMPGTDPDDLESSPVYGMFGQDMGSAVTWWPDVTDAEKKAALKDLLSWDADTAATTEDSAADPSSAP